MSFVSGLQRETELVDYQHEKMEWQNTIKEANRFENRIKWGAVCSHIRGPEVRGLRWKI